MLESSSVIHRALMLHHVISVCHETAVQFFVFPLVLHEPFQTGFWSVYISIIAALFSQVHPCCPWVCAKLNHLTEQVISCTQYRTNKAEIKRTSEQTGLCYFFSTTKLNDLMYCFAAVIKQSMLPHQLTLIPEIWVKKSELPGYMWLFI